MLGAFEVSPSLRVRTTCWAGPVVDSKDECSLSVYQIHRNRRVDCLRGGSKGARVSLEAKRESCEGKCWRCVCLHCRLEKKTNLKRAFWVVCGH